jgi:GSH-dependent disulfide-bond oxidoreductase
MIDLYTWPTPNGHKIHIMLEECKLAYAVHAVNISEGEQFKPDFLKISPNNKIPAILDHDGIGGKPYSVFESGAILLYLASKTGKFLGKSDRAKFDTMQWLMFQMGGVGPMLGQTHHFRIYAPEKVEYAINRYTNETKRLYGVIDKRLQDTIADIATWPWIRSWKNQGVELSDFSAVKAWFEKIEARPAVKRAVTVLADRRK